MRDQVSIVTRLILDRSTCLACIATKSGLTVREAAATLDVISEVAVYREPGRCLVCEADKRVFSVKRRAQDRVCALCAKPILGTDDKTIVLGVACHNACWSLETRTP